MEKNVVIHKFRDILEHDMDMLILEEFACSTEFSKIFLNKVNISDAKVLSTWQSKTDSELGESDMTVVLENDDRKFALLIEDKIDAIIFSPCDLFILKTLSFNPWLAINDIFSIES